MQLLLGIFFFSVVLTTGSALTCEVCQSQNSDCTGPKQECAIEEDTCMRVTTETNVGTKTTNTIKRCSTKNICKGFEDLKGKANTQQTLNVPTGAIIKEATCSKAPSSFASFFPVVLGFLLMKLLF